MLGWHFRLIDNGRRWVGRRGPDVVSDWSLATVLERVERVTARLAAEHREPVVAPPRPFSRLDARRAGWKIEHVELKATRDKPFSSVYVGSDQSFWRAKNEDGRDPFIGDTESEVFEKVAAVERKESA